MVTFATGGTHAVSYVKESVFGTTPAITATLPMLLFRLTQSSLVLNRDSFQSEELRGDQQISDLRLGVKQVNGDLNFELSYLHFDDMIEAVLGGTWAPTFTDTDTDWETISGTNTFQQTAGTDLTTVLAVNDYVRTSGFATVANNGIWKVVTVATDSFTVTPTGVIVTEAVGATVTVELLTGAVLKSALLQPSFSFEKQFNDITQFQVFTGVNVNTLSLSVVPNGIVTGAFGFLGQGGAGHTGVSLGASFEESVVDPSVDFSPMDSFSGQVDEGATIDLMTITAIDFTLTRNLDPAFVVGEDSLVASVPGRNTVTGTVSAFFEDEVLIDKFLNETESSLKFTLLDTASNQYEIFLPRVKYTGADNSVTSEGGVIVSLPFTALLDPTEATNIRITR